MKYLRQLLALVTFTAALNAPSSVAADSEWQSSCCDIEYCDPYCDEQCCDAFPDDPQAYHASAYRPYLTPKLVLGGFVVVTAIAILLINNQNHSRHTRR